MKGVNWSTIPVCITRYYLSLVNEAIDKYSEKAVKMESFQIPFTHYVSFEPKDLPPLSYHSQDEGELEFFLCFSREEKEVFERFVKERKILDGRLQTHINDKQLEHYDECFSDGRLFMNSEFKGFDPNSSSNDPVLIHSIFTRVYNSSFWKEHTILNFLQPLITEESESLLWQHSRRQIDGGQIGAFHRLWLYVFRNPLMFEPLFKERLKLDKEIDDLYEDEGELTTSVMGKVRYLDAVGGIEHIRSLFKMGVSNRSVARIVAKIIGENYQSVQPYVNAAITGKRGTNNPSHSTEDVKEVQAFFEKHKLPIDGLKYRDRVD
jgi:hypothetical protein